MFYINENEIDELDKYGYDSTGEYLLGRLNLSHTKFFDTREEAAFYQYKEALRLEKIAKQQADEAIIKSKKFYNKYREDIEKQTETPNPTIEQPKKTRKPRTKKTPENTVEHQDTEKQTETEKPKKTRKTRTNKTVPIEKSNEKSSFLCIMIEYFELWRRPWLRCRQRSRQVPHHHHLRFTRRR